MGRAELKDGELARRCRQGDERAWRQLVRSHTATVYRLSYRMLGGREEAEDAVQEVFLRVHRSFATFDPTRPLGPWLSRITYNVCLRRIEKRRRQPTPMEDDEPIARLPDTDTPGPEKLGQRSEAGAILGEALMKLAAQDRMMLELYYRDGYSITELAEVNGMPANTVKTRLYRARRTLKERLAPTFVEG